MAARAAPSTATSSNRVSMLGSTLGDVGIPQQVSSRQAILEMNQPFGCFDCEFRCTAARRIVGHCSATGHRKFWPCIACMVLFPTRQELDRHRSEIDVPAHRRCMIAPCNALFSTINSYKAHYRDKHESLPSQASSASRNVRQEIRAKEKLVMLMGEETAIWEEEVQRRKAAKTERKRQEAEKNKQEAKKKKQKAVKKGQGAEGGKQEVEKKKQEAKKKKPEERKRKQAERSRRKAERRRKEEDRKRQEAEQKRQEEERRRQRVERKKQEYTKRQMEEYLKRQRETPPPVQCHLCPKTFKTAAAYVQHLKSIPQKHRNAKAPQVTRAARVRNSEATQGSGPLKTAPRSRCSGFCSACNIKFTTLELHVSHIATFQALNLRHLPVFWVPSVSRFNPSRRARTAKILGGMPEGEWFGNVVRRAKPPLRLTSQGAKSLQNGLSRIERARRLKGKGVWSK